MIRITLSLLTFLSLGSHAATPIISYKTLPDRVRKLNPDLIAARYRIDEAKGRLKQSGRPANPELNFELTNNNRLEERALTVGFTQKFPVTERLRLEKDVSLHDVYAAAAEVSDTERRLIAEARQHLVSALALKAQRELRTEQITLSQELTSYIKKLADKGEASALDAGQARLELLQLKTKLRQIDAEEKAIEGLLKPLLGMSPSAPLILGGNLENLTIPPQTTPLMQRGDLRSAQHEIDGATKKVELEEARRYDDIEGGLFVTIERTEDAPEGFETEGVLGLALTIPLPLWDKNEGSIDEAKARVLRRKAELNALRASARHEIKSARDEMMQWSTVIKEIDGPLLSEAIELSDLAEQSYREGLSDLPTTLSSKKQALQLKASRIDALRAFHSARARFESAIGQ